MGSQLIQPSPRGRDPSKLTDAQRIFCAEYLANGLKGAQAARVAYPNAKNPAAMAEKVLRHPVAKGYLGKLLHNRLEQSGLSAERILKQLETALFLDPLDLFEATGESGVYRVRSLEQVPGIVSRICAICSTNHVVTCLHALENALGVKVSAQTRKTPRPGYASAFLSGGSFIHPF